MDENAAHHVVPENVPVRVVCRKDASICDLTATKGETGTHRTVDISTALLSWYFLHVRRRRKRGMYVKEGRNLQVAPVKQAHFVINSEARNIAQCQKPEALRTVDHKAYSFCADTHELRQLRNLEPSPQLAGKPPQGRRLHQASAS